MNTSRDEQRPKLFDERSIVKLNRGEGGSPFSILRRYLSLILGGEGKIRVRHFLQKTFHSPQTRIRGVSVRFVLAKLEKMDNAFQEQQAAQEQGLVAVVVIEGKEEDCDMCLMAGQRPSDRDHRECASLRRRREWRTRPRQPVQGNRSSRAWRPSGYRDRGLEDRSPWGGEGSRMPSPRPGDHSASPLGRRSPEEEEDSDMTASRGRRWSGGTPPPGSAPPSSP